MLITFEGLDGSGKSTQIRAISGLFASRDISFSVFREPGGTALSEMIRGLLLNPEIDIPPVSEMLLFSAARAALVSQEILPRLDRGEVVIMDRFFDSTTAYQFYGRQLTSIEAVSALNNLAGCGIVPDLTVYLRLDPSKMGERLDTRRKDRMEQNYPDFFTRVCEGYDAIAARESRFLTLNAEEPVEKITSQIWDRISTMI